MGDAWTGAACLLSCFGVQPTEDQEEWARAVAGAMWLFKTLAEIRHGLVSEEKG